MRIPHLNSVRVHFTLKSCVQLKMNETFEKSQEEDFIQLCHLETKQVQRYILTLYFPMLSGNIVQKKWKVFFSFSLRRLTLINRDTGASLITTKNKINYTFSYLLCIKLCDVVDTLYPASSFENQEEETGHPRSRECTKLADRRIGNIGQQIQ